MGKIVGGFIVPHDPFVFVNPKKLDSSHILEAYEEIRRRITVSRATTAIIIGADHYILFSPKCLPQLLICLGELNGPVDQLPGLPNRPIPHNATLAGQIFDYSQDTGFDLAVAKAMAVDHSVGVPAHLCLPEDGAVKVVSAYMASGVSPTIKLSRAYRFGMMLKDAVEAQNDDERVVVIGSGGISHWVGVGEMGKVDTDFDKLVLEAFVDGNPEPLLAMSDDEIMHQGGNGAMEIRQFLGVMGALPGGKGEIILYDAWKGGVTGLGFAELRPAV